MSRKPTRGEVRPHGQIRQSQVVTTFGPGAMVDLPDHSVIIAGLEEWNGHRDHPILEDRLAVKVRAAVGVQSVEFYAPPADRDDPTAPVTGITAWLFPESSASNAYFAQTLSVISIPEPGGKVKQAVEEVWADFLQYCESLADVTKERKKAKVSAALEDCSDAEAWAEIQRRKGGALPQAAGIRQAEFETLMKSPDQAGEDAPDGVFFARTTKRTAGEPDLMKPIGLVVKVHRLREVIAQIGFTRFEAPVPDVNGELALGVERAALSLNQSWFPAIENRGEGIFIGIRAGAVDEWIKRPAVQARGVQLLEAFNAWRAAHQGAKAEFPGLPYVMLHTLSHLLITAVSLDCGYASSSIRERIYVVNGGYGILLYTASPDAEGTLGGLVEAADRIDRYLRQAVDLGRLCSNDPVCAQHRADSREEDRLLLGAACHGCVLLPESSCERRNDFLDRALVVPTVDGAETAFFDVDES